MELTRWQQAKKVEFGASKKAVLESRYGIRLPAPEDEASDWDSSEENRSSVKDKDRKRKGKRKATEDTDSSAAGSDDSDAAERKEHLAGGWRKTKFMKENPGFMSARRRALEEKYNPLIRLLSASCAVGHRAPS